jgi:hypothetical protein
MSSRKVAVEDLAKAKFSGLSAVVLVIEPLKAHEKCSVVSNTRHHQLELIPNSQSRDCIF